MRNETHELFKQRLFLFTNELVDGIDYKVNISKALVKNPLYLKYTDVLLLLPFSLFFNWSIECKMKTYELFKRDSVLVYE